MKFTIAAGNETALGSVAILVFTTGFSGKFSLQITSMFKCGRAAANKSIANSGAGRWSNRQQFAISFGSGWTNSFEHQNKFLIFE